MKYNMMETPDYVNDLIIYEIATKGFTSPKGPESGTFNSLREKLTYLRDLGITGIWLTGHHLCDEKHFYNIWTEYACIDPGKLDPSLGTEEEFGCMIKEAHKFGIKVFLDVITHGVMEYSPLVEAHPKWFTKGSWGMIDFDWYGSHPDMEEWWIQTWLRFVKEFDVDGFRLDVAHYRNDIWAEIRKRCREAGKDIFVIAENGPAFPGVIDMLQHGERFQDNVRIFPGHRMLWDGAGHFLDRQRQDTQSYLVEIRYEDGTRQNSFESRSEQEGLKLDGLQAFAEEIQINDKDCDRAEVSYREEIMIMRLENVKLGKPIADIIVMDREGHKWHSSLENTLDVDYWIKADGEAPSLRIEFPLRQQAGTYLSNQLSCHDGGWDGFPLDQNPYMARGSRYVFGYGFALTPAVPVFMSGEEFNADYVPLPGHSPRLFGGELNGQGRWLYGSWIQWEQLEREDKKDMLQDVKEILKIRREYCHLVHPFRMECEDSAALMKVPFSSKWKLPVPYMYLGEKEALCIMANPTNEKVSLSLQLSELIPDWENVKAEVLFGGGQEVCLTNLGGLDQCNWELEPDKQAGGGLKVVLFTREGAL